MQVTHNGLRTPHSLHHMHSNVLNFIFVQVTHNGLCHTDAHMIDNDWGASGFPFVPGHEVVGVVAAKGSQVTEVEVRSTCQCLS